MKSILEQALVHLLNQRTDMAEELMHQFVVERAKEIHESLRESDDIDLEGLDDETLEEEFFTEADLEDAEAADNLVDDLDDTAVADDLGDEGALDDAAVDVDADLEGEVSDDIAADVDADEAPVDVDDLADKIDDLEDEIKAMQDEFDRIMAEFDAEDVDSEADTDTDADDSVADFDDTAEDGNGEVDLSDAEVENGEDFDDEFDDITESIVDDLKKVAVPNQDGKGATGQSLSTPTDSPIAKDAKPQVLRSKNTVGHKGWDRENAPAKKDGPDRGRKYDNNRNKATDGNSAVPAAGPKKAELSKPVAGNTKSVIQGSKKK